MCAWGSGDQDVGEVAETRNLQKIYVGYVRGKNPAWKPATEEVQGAW